MLKIEIGEQNKILRAVAKEIKPAEYSKAIKLGKEMVKYIKNPKHGGVGLAAPQVGYSTRLIVVSLLKNWDDENFKTVMMINPEVLEHNQEKDTEKEGCLSLPGQEGEVSRYTEIKLKYIDEKKSEKIIHLSGTAARIVQHEIDHIDGILFVDYAK